MGVKLQASINAIPASFSESKLRYHIGKKEVTVDIPAISTLTFKEQCNQFISSSIFAYLLGEEYSIVLRHDGTGTVFKTKGRILVKNFTFEKPDYSRYFITKGGAVMLPAGSKYYPIELFTDGINDYVISVPSVPISVTFQGEDNPLYLKDVSTLKSDAYPETKIFFDTLYAVDSKGSQLYQIDGLVSLSKSFVVL